MDVREKLVKFLNNSFVEQYEKRGLLTAQHKATDLIANGVTVQEWIPVNERCAYIGITSLVADVNVNEISDQIRNGTLAQWVESWQRQMALELENCRLSATELEKLRRENFWLKTTVKNLRAQVDEFYRHK